MGYIYLQPVGEIGGELLNYLGARLEDIFNHTCRIELPIKLPADQYDANRGQYNATGLVKEIADNMPADAEKVLGIVDADLFVQGMNFIFGVTIGDAAVISLTRLKPEYYGEKKDEPLFRERAMKEAVHEIGHMFGLGHCLNTRCVMHFSNSLEDTDIKGVDFCSDCSAKISLSG